MSKKIHVGNLSFSSTEADLKDAFGRHGAVETVNVITDRETGRAPAADDAIRALDGSDLGGRNIKVNEARPRRDGAGATRF
jgi:RNA recognition motif-containing protein